MRGDVQSPGHAPAVHSSRNHSENLATSDDIGG